MTVTGSLTGDPKFVNTATYDFHLQSGSPAVDAGTNSVSTHVKSDYAGATRPQGTAYDIGAHEYLSGYMPGNTTVTFPQDTTAPVRSAGAPAGTLAAGTSSVTLSVITDEPATCRYGTGSNVAFTSLAPMTTTGSTAHTVAVTAANGGSYRYAIRCSDAAGNTNADDYAVSFSVANTATTNPLDGVDLSSPTAPMALAATTTASAATLTWQGSTDNVGVIGYQVRRAGVQISSVTATEYTDTGLTPNTVYLYSVSAIDAAGNAASSELTTKTASSGGTTTGATLELANIAVRSITANSAVIEWTTTQPSTSQVRYGKTAAYTSATPVDTALLATHRIVLTGLSPRTTYHYSVLSTAAGNTVSSADAVFKTARWNRVGAAGYAEGDTAVSRGLSFAMLAIVAAVLLAAVLLHNRFEKRTPPQK
jgi:hypothetical protein